MKFTLSVIFFVSFFISHGKVVIKGKILHYDGKSIIYYHQTIEGIFTPYWKELLPGAGGNFRVEYENEGYGTATLSFQGLVYKFFHDANTSIYLEIDQRKIVPVDRVPNRVLILDSIKQKATTQITGKFQEINRFYNRTIRSGIVNSVDGNYFSKIIRDEAEPLNAMRCLDSLMQLELIPLEALPFPLDIENPEQEKVNQEVREFLETDITAFYGGIFLNAMFLKRKDHVLKLLEDSTASVDIYNERWEKLIESFEPILKNKLKPASSSLDYNQLLESLAITRENYKKYYYEKSMGETLDDFVFRSLFKFDTTIFNNPNEQFAHQLQGLQRFLNDQLFHSPSLLSAVYALQAKYPSSENLKFYEPLIKKLKSNIESSSKPFDKGKIVKGNYQTLEDLLLKFRGKNVLIDIWATWCHPCVEDFKYKKNIQPLMDSVNLEVLYISIDKPEWEDRWKNSIKFNQLEGFHFRAEETFIKNMWNTLKGWEGVIPRYALIDEHGKLFLASASRPGNDNALRTEIKQLASNE